MTTERIRTTKEGIWVLEGDPWISKWVEDLGRLDHDRTIDLLCARIPVGGVVIDAGAAIGDHSVFYGHRVGPTGLVLAYEPNPDAYACLVMNTRHQPWIHPHRAGLGEWTSMMSMAYDRSNIWASHIATTTDPSFHNVDVLIRPIDAITAEYGLKRLDFLKLDVEGFEPEVIKGAWQSILNFRPLIATEMNIGALARFGKRHSDIFKPLEEIGYKMEFLDPRHTLDMAQFDCLFVPNDQALPHGGAERTSNANRD